MVAGLHAWGDVVVPSLGLAVAAGAYLSIVRGSRAWAGAVALLAVLAGGTIIGAVERVRARVDCRRTLEAGAELRVVGLATTFLPSGERGPIRVRPIGRARSGCRWIGELRLWGEGPVSPGWVYAVDGRWQPSPYAGSALRSPDRRGWLTAERLEPLEAARATAHPLLALRRESARRLWAVYPRRWAPLALALVLGSRETVDPEVRDRMARSGLAHLLAISGLHVGLLAAALWSLTRLVRCPVRVGRLATLTLVGVYVSLIGAPASAVRAALMVTMWTLTRLAGRASAAFDVLGLAAVLLLLARPWGVVEPGVQLSFAGAGAVGFAHARAVGTPGFAELPRAWRVALSGLIASAAAVMLTAPITASYFGRVTPIAVFGNLVALPLLGLAMPALFASALTASWPDVAAWPAGAAVLLLSVLDALAGRLDDPAWAAIDVAPPGPVLALAWVGALVLAGHAFQAPWRRAIYLRWLGVGLAVALVWAPVRARTQAGRLEIHALAVGQGDAIAIATPGRRWILIDAGPNVAGFDAGRARVVPYLRRQGVRQLDAWIVSHPDLDHVGGGPSVIRDLRPRRVIGPGRVTGQGGQLAVLRQLAGDSIPWIRAAAGDRLDVDGLRLEVLHPHTGVDEHPSVSPNDQSLVFRASYGRFRMLFTGDISATVEAHLLEDHDDRLSSTLLKVAHHGSATSTSTRFLEAVDPGIALISVGRSNPYGHPAPEVLHRLSAAGVSTHRTDREGALMISVDRTGSWRLRSAAAGL